MAIKLIYKDIAPDAKDDITNIETSEVNDNLSNVGALKSDKVSPVRYATLEYNQWRLDGTYKALTNNNIPYMSTQVSSLNATTLDNGVKTYLFDNPVSLTRIFENKHQSVGVSFTFDYPDYCNYLTIEWFNDEESQIEYFYPDNTEYYCQKNIEIFNKVVVTFYGMNKPNRLLKLWTLDDGVNRIYTDKDVLSINILEEMSLISEDIPVNTLDFSLYHKENIELMFQKKQPILAYHNNELAGMFFIDIGDRTSQNIYDVSANDYKGVLENNTFNGGIYFDELAGNIINDIFKDEKITLEIDEETFNTKLSGHLKIDTKRAALMQVLFATCSVCSTARTDTFKIFKLKDTLSDVPSDRIKEGGSVKASSKPTSVKISIHKYTKETEIKELFTGEVLAGDNIIQFSTPVDASSVTVTGATLKEVYANYCIVNATENKEITVKGYQYVDNITTKEIVDPNKLLGKAFETKEITDATLISNSNYEAVLLNVYNHYMKNNTLECDIQLLDEQVGDNITLHTAWSGDKTGRIEQLDYDIKNKKIGKVVQRING